MSIREVGHDSAHHHLAEMLELLRADLKEFREEMRGSLSERVTHTELQALHQLFNSRMENVMIQAGQREDALRARIDALSREREGLNDKLDKVKKENDALQRYFFRGTLGVVAGLVGTNVFQGFL